MKIAQEQKSRNLDIFYVDGLIENILEQMLKEVDNLTPEESVHFKETKNLIVYIVDTIKPF